MSATLSFAPADSPANGGARRSSSHRQDDNDAVRSTHSSGRFLQEDPAMSTAYPPIPYDGSDLPRSPRLKSLQVCSSSLQQLMRDSLVCSGGGAPIMQTEIDGARPAMRSISPGRDHQSMRLRRKNTAGSDSLSYDMYFPLPLWFVLVSCTWSFSPPLSAPR
eukprot:1940512-Rhodomonas_salina.1